MKADANIGDNFGMIPISIAAENGHLNIVKLLTVVSDITKVDHCLTTCIGYAIDKNHVEIVEYFLDLGMNINHVNCDGKSYLHNTICDKFWVNRNEMVKLLLNRGIDINIIDEYGRKASQYTTEEGILSLFP